jgi:hypothetical protein
MRTNAMRDVSAGIPPKKMPTHAFVLSVDSKSIGAPAVPIADSHPPFWK